MLQCIFIHISCINVYLFVSRAWDPSPNVSASHPAQASYEYGMLDLHFYGTNHHIPMDMPRAWCQHPHSPCGQSLSYISVLDSWQCTYPWIFYLAIRGATGYSCAGGSVKLRLHGSWLFSVFFISPTKAWFYRNTRTLGSFTCTFIHISYLCVYLVMSHACVSVSLHLFHACVSVSLHLFHACV